MTFYIDVAESEDEDTDPYKSVNPPIVVKPKNANTRRKQHDEKQVKNELQQIKLEKKKITDIHRYARQTNNNCMFCLI